MEASDWDSWLLAFSGVLVLTDIGRWQGYWFCGHWRRMRTAGIIWRVVVDARHAGALDVHREEALDVHHGEDLMQYGSTSTMGENLMQRGSSIPQFHPAVLSHAARQFHPAISSRSFTSAAVDESGSEVDAPVDKSGGCAEWLASVGEAWTVLAVGDMWQNILYMCLGEARKREASSDIPREVRPRRGRTASGVWATWRAAHPPCDRSLASAGALYREPFP